MTNSIIRGNGFNSQKDKCSFDTLGAQTDKSTYNQSKSGGSDVVGKFIPQLSIAATGNARSPTGTSRVRSTSIERKWQQNAGTKGTSAT